MTARLTAALMALLLVFTVTGFLSPVPASAGPAASALQRQRQGTVTVVLESLKPTVLGPKTKKLGVQAKITNVGSQPLVGLEARLLYGERFSNRSQLEDFSKSATDESVPGVLDSKGPFDLAPGASRTVKLANTASHVFAHRPGELSVYPLAVTVSSATLGRIGGAHTYINYVPKDAKKNIQPTRVAFIWPLIDTPHRTTDRKFYDDNLAASLDAGAKGRLNTLLNALGSGSDAVTLAIDPSLLTDIQAMQKDYRIRDRKEDTPKSPAATAWLSKLKTYLKNPKNEFFLTPYADVDTVALVNRRFGSGEASLLKAAYADKRLGLDVLGRDAETYPKLAWPNNGTINQATIDRLVANKDLGSSAFLLSSNQLTANAASHTPNAATTVQTSKGAHKVAIAFDDTLQQIVSGDTSSPGAALGARQRYLAETAMITAEAPSQSRTLVVAPDRRWNPGLDFARSLLETKDARSAWLKPVSLGDIAAAKNRTPDERQLITYTDGDRELSQHYLETVKAMNKEAYAFSKIFTEPDTSLQRAAMRVASGAWRGTGKRIQAAYSYQDKARKDHDAEIDKIGLVSGTEKQLAGSSGVLKFTIVNEFPQESGPVDILIKITTYPLGQLVFPGEDGENGSSYVLERRIEAGQKDTIQVPVKLPTGSSLKNEVEVEVKIFNKDVQEVNSQSVFVKTTGFSSVGLFITVGALGVLVIGVGFRGVRARRRRKEEEAQHDGAAV